jgi:hypothetical protein
MSHWQLASALALVMPYALVLVLGPWPSLGPWSSAGLARPPPAPGRPAAPAPRTRTCWMLARGVAPSY